MYASRANVLLLLLFLACPARAQTRPDTVSLRFKWPDSLSARVEQDWSRIRTGSVRADTVHVRSSYRLDVQPHPEGRVLRTSGFAAPQVRTTQNDTSGFLQRLLAQTGTFSPTYVVSRDGVFVRVEAVREMKAAMDTLFAPLFKEIGSALPQAARLFQNMFTERSLSASAEQEWNLLVGTWVDADWELGSAYGVEADEPSPMFPGMMIPMQYEFGATERVKCTSTAATAECVELRMRSTADPDVVRTIVQRFVERLGTGVGDSVMSAMHTMLVENDVALITQPATLRPYRLEVVKYVEVRSNATATQKADTTYQIDRRSYTYVYDR